MNYNQPQSRNYLAYDVSRDPFDKYEGYAVTNFDQSGKNLNGPSNILNNETFAPNSSSEGVPRHVSHQQQLFDTTRPSGGWNNRQQIQQIQTQPKGFEVLNTPTEKQGKLNSTSNYFQCPLCLELAISSCDCEYRDCSCSNGHKWYRVSGVKTMGISPNHRNN